MEARHPEVGKHISGEGTLSEDMETKLKAAIAEFKKQFVPSEEGPGTTAGAGGGPVDKLREDVGWERVGEQAEDETGSQAEP
jgi:hypothetical protein